MLPTLQPLASFDRELLVKLIDYVSEVRCFDEISDLLRPFVKSFNHKIKTRTELRRYLHCLENAVFNHLVSRARELPCFKREDIQQSFRQWSEIRDSYSVRFVWLLIEDQEVTLLNKSSKYYDDLSDCLTDGWCYKPVVDYIESRAFEILTYEVKTVCDYVLPTPLLKYHRSFNATKDTCTGEVKLTNSVLFKGVRYTFEVTGDHVSVRMPWWIENSENERRYIFYIKKKDLWLYSAHKDISKAVQQ